MTRKALYLFIGVFTSQSSFTSSLADLFSSPATSVLTTETINSYFEPVQIVELSRDRCLPFLVAKSAVGVPIIGSFISTTLHRPCNMPQNIVVIEIRLSNSDPEASTLEVRRALLALNGTPCLDQLGERRIQTFWSDPRRALALIENANENSGFTLMLYNRRALNTLGDDEDKAARDHWESTLPSECRLQSP